MGAMKADYKKINDLDFLSKGVVSGISETPAMSSYSFNLGKIE